MRILAAFTTYNRRSFFETALQTFLTTRNSAHDWTIIVADNGSCDGIRQWLYETLPEARLLSVRPRGIHYQVNAVFKLCETLPFDYAFRMDDDLVFKKPGWDDLYVAASRATGFDHLVLHDPAWPRKKHARMPVLHPTGLVECRARDGDTQGAFWTFTPRVLECVGYFDTELFGPCGFGHRDYTFRCCRAGFNVPHTVFDIVNSDRYLELNLENYYSADRRFQKRWNSPETVARKHEIMADERRIYVPDPDATFSLR